MAHMQRATIIAIVDNSGEREVVDGLRNGLRNWPFSLKIKDVAVV